MSDQGDQGERGAQGEAGVAGRQGEAGVAGGEGRPGKAGQEGQRGERGHQGPQPKLRWAPALGYLLLTVAFMGTAWFLIGVANQNRQLIERNKVLIDRVAKDCVDVDGDLSYRHVMRGLIRMNHNRDPFTNKALPATITLSQRRALTAELLQRGLDEAGKVPPCIGGGSR